ncbi:hypothetical protein D3C81_1967050 [compost metagenome]
MRAGVADHHLLVDGDTHVHVMDVATGFQAAVGQLGMHRGDVLHACFDVEQTVFALIAVADDLARVQEFTSGFLLRSAHGLSLSFEVGSRTPSKESGQHR